MARGGGLQAQRMGAQHVPGHVAHLAPCSTPFASRCVAQDACMLQAARQPACAPPSPRAPPLAGCSPPGLPAGGDTP